MVCTGVVFHLSNLIAACSHILSTSLSYMQVHSRYNFLNTSHIILTLRVVHALILIQGCEQVGRALNPPAKAVLCGYVILGGFVSQTPTGLSQLSG